MKRVYSTTILTCLVIMALCFGVYQAMNASPAMESLRVGFIFDNDESTPYTYNFSLARDALEKKYGERLEIFTRSNVQDDTADEPLLELVGKNCDIIFLNGYSTKVRDIAAQYPDVQFCQVSYEDMTGIEAPGNYHTFKGEIHQARYVSGIAAGMKLREMIARGEIRADQALIGFIAAYPTSEVISGYTAFLLGVRSIVPEATMRVHYTQTWSSFTLEKSAARAMIESGCVAIAQHTDTIGPVVACEEAARAGAKVFHVGYNQGMSDIAPTTSLIATRIVWDPYVLGAVDAVMARKPIEKRVPGNVHGTDMSAGFDKGWVEVLDLNQQIAAEGTQAAMDAAIDQFRRGNDAFVFQGDYTGIDPHGDTCDLRGGYEECKTCSYPTFNYLLKDVITVE